MNDEWSIYQSKGKQLLLLAAAILMTSGGLIITLGLFIVAESFLEYLLGLLGLLGTIFFGFCMVFLFKQLIKGKKLVILNKEGFYDYSNYLATKDRLILWSEVTDIKICTIVGQPFVSVKIQDQARFLASLKPILRKAIQANLKLGAYEINITTQTAKDCSTQQLLEKMLSYWNQAKDVSLEENSAD